MLLAKSISLNDYKLKGVSDIMKPHGKENKVK